MTKWTSAQLQKLYTTATKNTSSPGIEEFKKAAKATGKSVGACERKFIRTNWGKEAFSNPESDKAPISSPRLWTELENIRLYDLKVNHNLDYIAIGDALNRSSISCERQFQKTDWSYLSNVDIAKKTQSLSKKVKSDQELKEKEHNSELSSRIVDWLVGSVKADPDVLKAMDKKTFDEKLARMLANPDSKFSHNDVTMPFSELKELALEQIETLGMAYPKTRSFGEGTYVIVGDSHGKNTSMGMFQLLLNINKTIKPDYIIHIGDISDDDNEISYEWQKFDNLVVVGSLQELHLLKSQVHQYDVVMRSVTLGDIVVTNQYDSGDFVKKSVGRIDPLTVPKMTIVNTHRHEMHSHCSYKEDRLIMSPGCLCRRHTIRTVKQLIFKNGYPSIRQTHPHGFRKYNKQEQDSARWEQGIIIVEVDKNNKATPALCRIRHTKLGHTTSFSGKIYGEASIEKPDQKIFFNGDMHCSLHDPKVLDIQEQFCNEYKPDILVNVGDLLDNRGLNHHMGGTAGAAFYFNNEGKVEYKDSAAEIAASRFIMARMRKWSTKSYLIIGNHERFAQDAILRFPQLQSILDIRTLLGTSELDIHVTDLKQTLDFGCIRFVHGDVKVWGGFGGSKVDKIATNYGDNTVMGNIHYPAVRSGCYSVPMTGLLNQQYNEVDASQWMQGFGYANVFDNQCFVTIVPIMNNQCIVDGKQYTARDCSSWDTPKHKIRIEFEYAMPQQREDAHKTPQKVAKRLKATTKDKE